MKVLANAGLIDLLSRNRLLTATTQIDRWKVGDTLAVHPDAELEPYAHILAGATIPRRFGAFSYSHSRCDIDLSVGRYSSMSWAISVMGSSHPADWASSSPFSYNPQPLLGFRAYLQDVGAKSFILHKYDQGPQSVTIGNDVWIGAEVMFKRGVTIGDGAVVGTRSLVTKDVPPYAVVAGSPARIIRYRFPEPLIERLLKSQWWRYGPDVLQPLDVREPEGFLDRLEEKAASGEAVPLDFTPLTGQQMIAASQAT